jgi:D-alanine-D-alanine ligase
MKLHAQSCGIHRFPLARRRVDSSSSGYPVGTETRILLLSSRDHQEGAGEPPSQWRRGEGHTRGPSGKPRADSVAPVAEHLLETVAATPGVRVAHRSVFHPSEVLAAIGDHRPDVVLNLCEGLGGDSRLEVHAAWLLERLRLPFTGSPFHALRHCLYKLEANQLLARAGVRVPATVRVDNPDSLRHLPRISLPAIVKPEREDGSLGIESTSVVHTAEELRAQVAHVVETYRQPAIVQRYIHGRELSVSLLGWPTPRVLPPGEILFHDLPEGHPHILTFDSKWDSDSVAFLGTPSVPAVLRPRELRRVAAIGRRAFDVLGLRDYGRVDVRLDERGDPHVIDVNPNCDLSEDGGFARAAVRAGLRYADMVWEILRSALRRREDDAVLFASRGRSSRARLARPRAVSISPVSFTGATAAP